MKKIILLCLFLLLPYILLEIFLSFDNDFYKRVLLYNSNFIEWQQAAPKMNYWPDVIIMGSSIAKQSIDPKEIEKKLSKNKKDITVGNIGLNAGATSADYLTLKRILKTCKDCPKVIVYQVTDFGLRNGEIRDWKDPSLRRVVKIYFQDNEVERVLKNAANLDPYYKQYFNDIKIYSILKVPFTQGRLFSVLVNDFNNLFGFSFINNYKPIYRDSDVNLEGDGFFSRSKKMDNKTLKASLHYQHSVLDNYEIGGAQEYFFKEFLNLANKNNIQVVLVLTPEYEVQQREFSKEEKVLTNFLSKLSKEKKVVLIDNRNYKSNDMNLFFDLKHLNSDGSSVYSKYLGQELSKFIK